MAGDHPMATIPFPPPPPLATSPANALSLGPLSLPAASSSGEAELGGPARVRVADVAPYEGAPYGGYVKAVEIISGSLTRLNAAVIELGSAEMAVIRCAFEGSRMYFRARAANGGKAGRGVYIYRAGRALEDGDSSPPCMAEAFRCLGKVARAALCAIARHLRLRSDVFNHLLDDNPLPPNEISSSVLAASYTHSSFQAGRFSSRDGKPSYNTEVEKGLLTLIASDSPAVQVCDPSGRWYLADNGLSPGDLLLLTGKALSHATAGLRPASAYRFINDYSLGAASGGRTSLAFRLLPQGNAILDCSPIAAVGHVIPQRYVPISVSQFMDDLSAEDVVHVRYSDVCDIPNNLIKEPPLRSVLSDPISGAYLEDAMHVSCGHSFGGLMLRKVLEMSRCTLCNTEIEPGNLIPNHALRAAASAVKQEDNRRLFHNSSLRKRRKVVGDQIEAFNRLHKVNGEMPQDGDSPRHKGVQYPFAVNEKVFIKGNRRTPHKFVGREAIITSQCLNGCIHCGKLIKYLHVQTGLPILIGVAMKGKKKGGWLAWTLCMPEIGRRNFHCSIYMDSTVGIIQMMHIKTSQVIASDHQCCTLF